MQNYWNFYLACKQLQLYGTVNFRAFRETGPKTGLFDSEQENCYSDCAYVIQNKVGLIFRFEIIDASKKHGRNVNFATSLILSSKLLQIASIWIVKASSFSMKMNI